MNEWGTKHPIYHNAYMCMYSNYAPPPNKKMGAM